MAEPGHSAGRQAVLILGMHRSGTSVLSGLLAGAGLDLGKTLMPPAEDNPRGFWENQRLVDINEAVLNIYDQSWSSFQALPGDWLDHPSLDSYRRQISEVITEEFDDSSVICVKDPRLCRIFPLWQQVLGSLNITVQTVLISRPMEEVVASLQARDGMGKAQAQALWLRYSLGMLQALENGPCVQTSYDQVLDNAGQVMAAIADLTGLTLTVGEQAFVEPSLRHHQHTKPGSKTETNWAAGLYQHLCSATYPLPAAFESLVLPLVEELATLEQQAARTLAEPGLAESIDMLSARESLIFEQAQDAKRHASLMEKELAEGRQYVTAMELELEQREAYARSLEQELESREQNAKSLTAELEVRAEYIQSLEQALAQKDSDLEVAHTYSQSLQDELEKTRHNLALTREQLEQELRRFRHLRYLSGLLERKPPGK